MTLAKPKRGVWALGAITLVIVVIWGWVLPPLGRLPAVKRHEAFLEKHRINPAAMFWTEVRTDPTDKPVTP